MANVEQKGNPSPPDTKEQRKIELGDVKDYRYIPLEEVTAALKAFGYGPSKRRVDALYISKNGSKAVGVWRPTEEIFEGHFDGEPVLRGVEQAEAVGQTLLLKKYFAGEIPEGMSPRLTSVDLAYRNAAVPGIDINIAVEEVSSGKPIELVGFGQVLAGKKVLSEGYISGVMLPIELSRRLLNRTKEQQANAVPQFPLRG